MTKTFVFFEFFKKYRYPIFLLFIVFFLLLTNYKSGTFLSGWDNLQTELYPWLAVKRAFFSVWQEYQSFGLLAGMAHGSDLIRAVFIWLISFILPQNLIRYFYHFLMLFIGGLGAFKLFNFQLVNSSIEKQNKNQANGFIGSLFYILNLGTLQIFYLPFEPFSAFFAFLPWGIWIFIKLISNVKNQISKRDLFVFFLINLLGTPSFYVQQLFLVYLLILVLLTLGFIFSFERYFIKQYFLRSPLYLLLILLINSFWILPQLYFIKTSSQVVYEAKANQLATEDVYFQNREKGTLKYFLKLEGFYFDLFDKNNQLLFLPWKNHFKTFWLLQYLFAFLIILGLINSLRKKDYRFIFPFLLITIVFLNAIWPISLLDGLIRSNKLLNQIFRSPFTKFIITYSLIAAYFLTQGVSFLRTVFKKDSLFLGLLLPLIFIYSFPSFQGFFISPEMKVKIPGDYLQLIDYLKTVEKNKRIALLPDYTFWGWFFHKWGYNGSGFLWYGIEQPIVSRTFDVWSEKSENHFWETKAAIEAEDLNRFEKVLEKYNIDYILVDYSLIPVVGTMKTLQYDQINQLLNTSSKIILVKKWPNISFYRVNHKKQLKDFIFLKENLLSIGPKIKMTDYDNAYLDFASYYFNPQKIDVFYPFLDFFTHTRFKNQNWQIEETKNKFLIQVKANTDLSNYKLDLSKNTFQAILYQDDKLFNYSGSINAQLINRNKLKISIDKVLVKKINIKNFYQEECFRNTTCFGFFLPNLSQKYGYLLKIKNKNLAGRRLFFYTLDQTKKQALIEGLLKQDEDIFILPPKYQYGLGYNMVFHNVSYENLKSENELINIEVYLLPYENLKSLRFISPQFYLLSDSSQDRKIYLDYFEAKKVNYFTYQISDIHPINTQPPITLYLSQSYHPGWKAYQIQCQNLNLKCQIYNYFPFIFGKEIKEHVMVNNWANGWIVDEKTCQAKSQGCRIQIIFWPQYLQFLGFGLMILALIYVGFFYEKKHERRH